VISLLSRRRDLHNTSIDFMAAVEGLCGFTHMPTGRICRLPYRHVGACDLHPRLPSQETQRIQARSTQPHPKDP
jgi:hypothetical protein